MTGWSQRHAVSENLEQQRCGLFMNALNLDEQHALLKIVIERLERCNIPYMVAGAVAANLYYLQAKNLRRFKIRASTEGFKKRHSDTGGEFRFRIFAFVDDSP